MVKLPDPRLNAGEHTPATHPLDDAPHLRRVRGAILNEDGPKIPPLRDPIRGDSPVDQEVPGADELPE